MDTLECGAKGDVINCTSGDNGALSETLFHFKTLIDAFYGVALCKSNCAKNAERAKDGQTLPSLSPQQSTSRCVQLT